MNFKRLTMIAVLAAAQTALVIPAAGAEGSVQPETIQGISVNAVNSAESANSQSGSTAGVAGNSTSGDTAKGTTGDGQTITGGNNGTNDAAGTDNSGTTGEPDKATPENGNPGTTDGTGTAGEGASAEGENGQTGTTPGTSTETTPGTTTGETDGSATPQGIAAQTGANQLVLMMNSNKMYQDGKLYLAGQPMAVKNGVSYVAIRAMVERVGLKLTYDGKTKETIIIKDGKELRFKTNSSVYRVNGESKPMKGPSYQQKNTFMVPLTSITQALNIPYTVDQANKRVILSLSTKPVAAFTVQPSEIFAGETNVSYTTQSKTSNGLQIVDERWEGKQDIFEEVGTHIITHYVQDSSGQWSDPYTVTINVLKPNEPPVANFTTDKEEYKMGEMITITDQSTDDENAIVDRQWLNDHKAFFKPGPVTIRLMVTDKHGAVGEFQKTITITNETLYTEEEFNKLFTSVGDKYTFDGTKVPTWKTMDFTFTSEPATLIRSNSPETVYSEGLLYRETALGSTRFMLHHLNSTGKNMKLYVIATNTYTDRPAQITFQNFGIGGPNPYPELTGKTSLERYFQSMQNRSAEQVVNLAPGESKVIMTDVNKTKMKQGDTISALADAFSDYPVQYSVILIDENKDPLQSLPFLPALDRDVHNRGTYPDSVRLIRYDEPVGTVPARMVLGDNKADPNLKGLDGIYGTEASNAGNFGVLYKVTLSRVAPHSLITLNPRGGLYNGVVTVNGQVVQVANKAAVSAPNENSVLYRTGNYEESVEIMYTPSPGSNLPINLLVMPMPQMK